MSYISTLSKLNSYKAIVNKQDVNNPKYYKNIDTFGISEKWVKVATSQSNISKLKKYLSKIPYSINITILASLDILKFLISDSNYIPKNKIILANKNWNIDIPLDNQSLNFIFTIAAYSSDLLGEDNTYPPTPWMTVHRIFQDYGDNSRDILLDFIVGMYNLNINYSSKIYSTYDWSDLFTFGSARKRQLDNPTEAMVDLTVYYTIHGTLKGAFKFPKTFHGGNLNPSKEITNEFKSSFKVSYTNYLRYLKGNYLLI